MKLKNVHDFEDKIIGAESEQMFTIDTDNHVIFDILRNKMYSNPVAAICREVASNSRDANRESGRGYVPVLIKVYEPNELVFISDMSISFEDRGPGITPDRMASIFLKYGASTKRNTNSQTGGFGLGAKTPFAYSDTFTVVTVCEHEGKRMKYLYTAMIDSTGKGKMVLMDSSESKENTGTKIIVPINPKDREQFEKECIKATMFWEPRPVMKGFKSEVSQLTTVYSHVVNEAEDWKIMFNHKEGSISNYWVALIDGISYQIDPNKIRVPSYFETNHIVSINYDNGDLTVSANRETLQYDEDTIKKLETKLSSIKKVLSKKVTGYIGSAVSYIDACTRTYAIGTGISRNSNHYKKLLEELPAEALLLRSLYTWLKNDRDENVKALPKKWNDKTITVTFNIPGMICEIVRPGENGKFTYENFTRLNSHWEKPVVFRDTTTKDNKRNATLIKDNPEGFIMLSTVPGYVPTEEDIRKQIDFTFNWGISFRMYSEVEKDVAHVVKSNYKNYKKEEKIEVPAWVFTRKGKVSKSTLTYVRSEKKFEEEKLIIGFQDSLNIKDGVDYQLEHKCSVVAKMMQEHKIIILSTRSKDLYLKNAIITTIDQAIEKISQDTVYMQKLQDGTDRETAESALLEVDNDLELLLGVVHPATMELRRIVEEGEVISISTAEQQVFNLQPKLEITRDKVEEWYEKWKEENYMIYAAIDKLSEDWNYRQWKLGHRHHSITAKVKSIKETYAMINAMRKVASTPMKAVMFINRGSKNGIRRVNPVYLAK